MTILSYTLAIAVLLLKARPVATFGLGASAGRGRLVETTLKSPLDLDYDRVRACAESFGKCSLEVMERMKNGMFVCVEAVYLHVSLGIRCMLSHSSLRP